MPPAKSVPVPPLRNRLGRETKFRIIARPEKDMLHVACNVCGLHEFLVRERFDNYFFTCMICRTIGNLPGLLALEVDRSEMTPEEKEIAVEAIKAKYPHPKR